MDCLEYWIVLYVISRNGLFYSRCTYGGLIMNLDKKFTVDELSLIATLISHYCGDMAEDDDEFIGSERWKELWKLQEYFNTEANK